MITLSCIASEDIDILLIVSKTDTVSNTKRGHYFNILHKGKHSTYGGIRI